MKRNVLKRYGKMKVVNNTIKDLADAKSFFLTTDIIRYKAHYESIIKKYKEESKNGKDVF